MFKHGGDNIGEKYTSRMRDVLRGASRLFRGVRGYAPPIIFFQMVQFGAFWCIFGSDSEISKITIFYIKIL